MDLVYKAFFCSCLLGNDLLLQHVPSHSYWSNFSFAIGQYSPLQRTYVQLSCTTVCSVLGLF